MLDHRAFRSFLMAIWCHGAYTGDVEVETAIDASDLVIKMRYSGAMSTG